MSTTDWVTIVFVAFFIGLFSFVLGASYASKGTGKDYQRQAVSNNFAHWEVSIDGATTFKWNTNQ
jgi:hypothetical protein